jgi:hypothetical protein
MSRLSRLVAAHQAAPHDPCHQLLVQWDGLTWTDESAWLAEDGLSITESSNDDGTPQATRVTLELDNTDGRYTKGGSSQIAGYLTHAGQRVRLRLGYNGIYAAEGDFWGYLGPLEPKESSAAATMTAWDWVGAKHDQVGIVAAAIATDDVFRNLLGQLGETEGVDYDADAGEMTCQSAIAAQADPWEEFRKLAVAEGGRIYVDRTTGRKRFMNRTNARAALLAPIATFSRSREIYDSKLVQRDDMPNRLTLQYEDRNSAIADELVLEQSTPVGIPAATTWQVANDPTTWEGYTPGAGGNNEVQVVTLDATGGSFHLVYFGRQTTYLAWNATAATVEAALEALPEIGGDNVTVSGAAGGPYTATFVGSLGNQDVPQLNWINELFKGGEISGTGRIVVWTSVPGSDGTPSVPGTPGYTTKYGAGQQPINFPKLSDLANLNWNIPGVYTTIDTITCNTAADGSGTNVPATSGMPGELGGFSNAVHYVWVPEVSGGGAHLQLFNLSAAVVYLTVFKANGRPARTVTTWSTTINEPVAQAIPGVAVIPVTVSNPYLPSAEEATPRGQELVAYMSSLRECEQHELDGCPYLHPGDPYAILDDRKTDPADWTISYWRVVSHSQQYVPREGGGYSSTIVAAPGLPPGDFIVEDATLAGAEIPAVVEGYIDLRAEQGPWYAGPVSAGHATLYCDQGGAAT